MLKVEVPPFIFKVSKHVVISYTKELYEQSKKKIKVGDIKAEGVLQTQL